jgi:hypothetical protein
LNEIAKYCDINGIAMNISGDIQFLEVYLDYERYIFVGILRKNNTNIKRSATAQEYHSRKYDYELNKKKYISYEDWLFNKFYDGVYFQLYNFMLESDSGLAIRNFLLYNGFKSEKKCYLKQNFLYVCWKFEFYEVCLQLRFSAITKIERVKDDETHRVTRIIADFTEPNFMRVAFTIIDNGIAIELLQLGK